MWEAGIAGALTMLMTECRENLKEMPFLLTGSGVLMQGSMVTRNGSFESC